MESLIFSKKTTNTWVILQKKSKKPQTEIKTLQNQIQNVSKETTVTRTNESHNYPKEYLTKISSLKKTKDFDSVYEFFEELSSEDNHEMISKACEEGLWLKKTKLDVMNVLHVASIKGNLKLVKSLIECGCDKETKNEYGRTPLMYASWYNNLSVVEYLISVGADKDAKNKYGDTALIYASEKGHLEVVKYLISVGADKDAKNKYGKTALSYANSNVSDYLKSIGAK